MTDISKIVIPEPTDLPPGSRPAWRVLVSLVNELRRANNTVSRTVSTLAGDQNRVFTAIQNQSSQIANQDVAVSELQTSYVPAEPPLVPSAPTLSSGVSTVTVTWDGMVMEVPGQEYDESGAPVGTPGSPVAIPAAENAGFRYVYAEQSPTGIVGDPGDDEFVGDWERVGQVLNEAGRIIVRATMGDTLYYRLVTVSYSGAESGGSDVVSIVVVGVDAPDIEADAVTANSIAAGSIDGMIITGAVVQSDAAPDTGVKLTSGGFVAYNTLGDETVRIDSATGEATFTGTFTTGNDNDEVVLLAASTYWPGLGPLYVDDVRMVFSRPGEVNEQIGGVFQATNRDEGADTTSVVMQVKPTFTTYDDRVLSPSDLTNVPQPKLELSMLDDYNVGLGIGVVTTEAKLIANEVTVGNPNLPSAVPTRVDVYASDVDIHATNTRALGSLLSTTVKSTSNWNTAISNGDYISDYSATGAPVLSPPLSVSLFGKVTTNGVNRMRQELCIASLAFDGRTWVRTSSTNGASWGAWAEYRVGQEEPYSVPWSYAEVAPAWSIPSSVSVAPISASTVSDAGMGFGSNQYTIGEAGWYDLEANMLVTPGSAGLGTGIILGAIQVNGSSLGLSTSREWPQSNNQFTILSRAKKSLDVGDTVRVVMARSSTVTGAVLDSLSLSVRRIK